MAQIEVDFEVFKALTMQRRSETHTYNDVIRELLGFEPTLARRISEKFEGVSKALTQGSGPFVSRDLTLPNGTMLRVLYKGQRHSASIIDGRWVSDDGIEHSSPSAAAHAITQTNINGLRFWEAKRPSDDQWRKLDALRA